MKKLYDKPTAQQALGGIGTTKLYQLLNDGKIEGVKIGKLLRIKPESIESYIQSLPKYKEAYHG